MGTERKRVKVLEILKVLEIRERPKTLRLRSLLLGVWLSSVSFVGTTVFSAQPSANPSSPLYMGYLWHLHQPLYWPGFVNASYPRMERAWDTIQRQDQGRQHPNPEKLRDIFSVDDRVHVYQWRMADSLRSLSAHLWSGAQSSYSGSLIENINSLGENYALGYSPQWSHSYRQLANERNSEGQRRLDFVNFTFHHCLAPLLSAETLEMELRLHQFITEQTFGVSSKGYFPTEMAFASHMIPTLKKVGVEWSIIGNNHLARASEDFPVVIGSGGENCDLPNRADQLNPAQGANSYLRFSISRGITPSAPVPFAYVPHRTLYVDPQTGDEHQMVVIPADQGLSWKDGYSPWDLNQVDPILHQVSSLQRPPFFLLAHDGDNAWGGGYSYYQEWVGNLAAQAKSKNIELTTVDTYLRHFPVPANDFVHVESGAWVNAESDFGSPTYINWHWPPSYRGSDGRNIVDPSQGVSDKADFWRVNIATENSVKTAQQLMRLRPRLEHVLNPVYGDTHPVERAWHFYLGGLDSGFVYYGCHGDECERAVEAQTNALVGIKDQLRAKLETDQTGPTLFLPQRHPWNPGQNNFGVQYNYRVTPSLNSNFYVWTYGFDISGIKEVVLRIRYNGESSPPKTKQHQMYTDHPSLGAWETLVMHKRSVESVLKMKPEVLADYYWIEVKKPAKGYADYYIESTDQRGNLTRTPLQHVYVGSGTQSMGPK